MALFDEGQIYSLLVKCLLDNNLPAMSICACGTPCISAVVLQSALCHFSLIHYLRVVLLKSFSTTLV